MNQMATAPRNKRIEVKYRGKWYRVTYHDCQWMRDDPMCDNVSDAWAVDGAASPGHIELDEAEGWRKIEQPE